MDKEKIKQSSQEDIELAQRLTGLIGTPAWNAILNIVNKRFMATVSKWNTHSCPKCSAVDLKEAIEKEAMSLIRRGERSKNIINRIIA